MRKNRRKYIAALALLALFVVAVFLYTIDNNSKLKPVSAAGFSAVLHKKVIVDAGHGGLDGGAVSKNGTSEAGINLQISLKTSALLRALGIQTVVTREDENSLDFDPNASIRDNKNADLHARFNISTQNPESDFLSIHLNKFEQSSVRGAQVFYSANREESLLLANALQNRMRTVLDPDNDRRAKMSSGDVYLMNVIHSPAVTIECGFLSNPGEEALLASVEYQTKLAIAIVSGYIDYLAVESTAKQ